MAVVEQPKPPTLSVYELTLLFDEHPTVGLVEAICEQMATRPLHNRDLLFAMFGCPRTGPLPEWMLDRVTDEQARTLDLGLSTWRLNHPVFPSAKGLRR